MKHDQRIPLVIGNWKMNGTVAGAMKRVTALNHLLAEIRDVEVAIAPPFTALYSVSVIVAETPPLRLAGQNMYWEEEGAYTGEIAGSFLKEIGCEFVLLGHSERRRYFGETDRDVNQKVQAALRNDLTPVVCLGESAVEHERGLAFETVERQLEGALRNVAVHDVESLVIAYEPVWAIGTGKHADPVQTGELHYRIRNWLAGYFDAPTANRIRILYGGSVNPEVADAFMRQRHIDGLLVGNASLDPHAFTRIVKFKERIDDYGDTSLS